MADGPSCSWLELRRPSKPWWSDRAWWRGTRAGRNGCGGHGNRTRRGARAGRSRGKRHGCAVDQLSCSRLNLIRMGMAWHPRIRFRRRHASRRCGRGGWRVSTGLVEHLAPFKIASYHVPYWRRGPAQSGEHEHFNHLHSSTRFSLLKMKWRMLVMMPTFPLVKQKMIVCYNHVPP